MRARSIARLAVLAAVVALLAGCSSAVSGGNRTGGGNSSSGKQLQLRLVTSSAEGTCSAPALTLDGPSSACDRAGTTTYQLGESLGVITPISVVLPKDQGSAQSVILEFDKADTGTLAEVSRQAIEKHLAILLDGRVLSAPLVKNPITTDQVTHAFGPSSEAKQVAAELGASATS
jgi:preprotein translocase subunit SecD